MQGAFDLDALRGEAQEGLRVRLALETRGDVREAARIAVQIEGILPQVEAEPYGRERAAGELFDEGMRHDALVDGLRGLPSRAAPAIRGAHRLNAVTAT